MLPSSAVTAIVQACNLQKEAKAVHAHSRHTALQESTKHVRRTAFAQVSKTKRYCHVRLHHISNICYQSRISACTAVQLLPVTTSTQSGISLTTQQESTASMSQHVQSSGSVSTARCAVFWVVVFLSCKEVSDLLVFSFSRLPDHLSSAAAHTKTWGSLALRCVTATLTGRLYQHICLTCTAT